MADEWEKLQKAIRTIRELAGDYDVLEGVRGDQHRADVRHSMQLLDNELMCYLSANLKLGAELFLEVQP